MFEYFYGFDVFINFVCSYMLVSMPFYFYVLIYPAALVVAILNKRILCLQCHLVI